MKKNLTWGWKDDLATKGACVCRGPRFNIQQYSVLNTHSCLELQFRGWGRFWHTHLASHICMHMVHIHTLKQTPAYKHIFLHLCVGMCVYVCMEVQCVNVCICIPWHTCGSQKTTIASLAVYLIWIREGPLSLQSTPGQLACEQPRLSGLHRPSHLESTGIADRCYHIQLCKSPEDPDLSLSLHGKCAIYWAMSPTLDFLE